jgi:mRNA interferase MazF
VIILGIFSKIPTEKLQDSWILIQDHDVQFPQTGLKKTSLIGADKIATVSKLVLPRKLGYLFTELLINVHQALKIAIAYLTNKL